MRESERQIVVVAGAVESWSLLRGRAGNGIATAKVAAATLIVGAAVLVPAMLSVEGLPHWAGTQPAIAIVFLGLMPTALAALLRVSIIRRVGSGFMTLTNYQVPLWSMAFGAVLLKEALPPTFFAALALILGGMALSQRRA